MVLVRSLRESKAKLSELVDLASRGQDVLISVRGRVKARLTRALARRLSLEPFRLAPRAASAS